MARNDDSSTKSIYLRVDPIKYGEIVSAAHMTGQTIAGWVESAVDGYLAITSPAAGSTPLTVANSLRSAYASSLTSQVMTSTNELPPPYQSAIDAAIAALGKGTSEGT